MDSMTLYLFGCGCASAGFAARYIATAIEDRITVRRELQASCEHTWGPISWHAGYGTRHCKWCKKQQQRNAAGEWHDW